MQQNFFSFVNSLMDKLIDYFKIIVRNSNGAFLPKEFELSDEYHELFHDIFVKENFIGSGSDKIMIKYDVTVFSKDIKISFDKLKKEIDENNKLHKEEVNG